MLNYPVYDGQPDVVFSVNWSCSGTDGTFSGNYNGGTGIPLATSTPYIPYDQLTNDIVIGWVQSALGEDGVKTVYTDIDAQIAYAAVQIQNTPLPWSA